MNNPSKFIAKWDALMADERLSDDQRICRHAALAATSDVARRISDLEASLGLTPSILRLGKRRRRLARQLVRAQWPPHLIAAALRIPVERLHEVL